MAYSFRYIDSISDIDQDEWDSLVAEDQSPYHEWAWLHSLESSGSIGPRSGWAPTHLVVRDGKTLVAAAPLYVKTNSDGEYVYDWGWADIARQLGQRYYPKLVATIPATPSADYRFLLRQDLGDRAPGLRSEMIEAIKERAAALGCHSVHMLFVDKELEGDLRGKSWPAWNHHRYLWENRGYADFQAFLADFGKNQRRNIRRERDSVAEQEIEVRIRPLDSLDATELPRHVQRMWDFYEKTNEQFGPWAAKFMNRKFFDIASKSFASRLCFVEARLKSEISDPDALPIAMAFLLRKNKWLYGRFWGAEGYYPDLHFEVCYYAPIQWAIEQGIEFFDPGAGSPHKIRRGFLTSRTDSYHWFLSKRMHQTFEMLIPQVNQAELSQISELNAGTPLRVLPGQEPKE